MVAPLILKRPNPNFSVAAAQGYGRELSRTAEQPYLSWRSMLSKCHIGPCIQALRLYGALEWLRG